MPWNPLTRILFRFFFLYFVLYVFPFPVTALPFIPLPDFMTAIWSPVVNWVSIHILKLDYTISVLPNGSGDTTWNFVQVFTIFLISVVGSVIWSVTDRRRSHYNEMFYWLTVGLRYYVGVTLIGYGFVKIVPTQFPLMPERLTRSYGESSPMGLLWTFMSFSPAYNFFTGAAEALGGLLLFFRPTKMIGALLSFGVLSNIVMLNFTYDVPVKLFSMHLLMMTVMLLMPDLSRMIDFFLLNKTILPRLSLFDLKSKKFKFVYVIGKGAVVAGVLASNAVSVSQYYTSLHPDENSLSPIGGVYEVDTHVVNADTLPPVENDTRRWRKIKIAWSQYVARETVSIEYMDHAQITSYLLCDTINHQVKFVSGDSTTQYNFKYARDGDRMSLKGTAYKDSIRLFMRKVDNDLPPLLSRGFHWINETPYNR